MRFDRDLSPTARLAARGQVFAADGREHRPLGGRRRHRARKCRSLELAIEHPESVRYQTWARQKRSASLRLRATRRANREVRTLPAQTFPPAFVAQIAGRNVVRPAVLRDRTGRQGRPRDGFLSRRRGADFKGSGEPAESPLLAEAVGQRRHLATWLPPKQRIDGRVAVLNARYSHNYFHWLIEILPRVVPMRRAGIAADYYLVDCLSPFQQTALAASASSGTN